MDSLNFISLIFFFFWSILNLFVSILNSEEDGGCENPILKLQDFIFNANKHAKLTLASFFFLKKKVLEQF